MSRYERDEDLHGSSWQTRHAERNREFREHCITGEVFTRSDAMTTTCGPLYQAGLESFTGMDEEKIPIFAAGFVSGQAEKIHLGACGAAMFRPSEEWHATVMAIVRQVAERYWLRVIELRTSRGMEIWLCKSRDDLTSVVVLDHMEENSPEWHRERGLLCGIPASDIDEKFHERAGRGEPCDVPMTETI